VFGEGAEQGTRGAGSAPHHFAITQGNDKITL